MSLNDVGNTLCEGLLIKLFIELLFGIGRLRLKLLDNLAV